MLKKLKNNRAFTIIELSVAVVIGGMGTFAAAYLMHSLYKGEQAIKFKQRHLSLREEIRLLVDCTTSYTAGTTCPSVDPNVEVFRKDGAQLIDPAGTRFGNYMLRAQCNDSNDGLEVHVSLLEEGRFINDTNSSHFGYVPGTKERFSWEHPKAHLFPRGTLVCPIEQ